MKHDALSSGKRKAVNLSLDTGVVAAAREAGLNLSQICEAALRDAARGERDRQWQEENREWIEANNAWVEKHGLPLAKYRMF
ncbi:type II toxin-antitoxin system CcdA family antitoxin [Sphingomonas sp. HITSZ_GF]|uniref:type II toxin-antitoxin system CcdA family antitoxin n=1 Tax=Sphingomonas sp. HITSZ_GF TaxID=3037247 RepID=UPI00240D25D2|nr:type II toxin-antitoxin system CcdA family antitoxin [Sphingomonas sp. HITSZ_GF]MDG2533574.1 type II toxin-antitoxin system CcdA family antitoxin [Sphingomonas sp. HITSZ_GF]